MSESNEQMTVVVIGGYGAVGTAVCEELARTFADRSVSAVSILSINAKC